jgi:hypothetical protein
MRRRVFSGQENQSECSENEDNGREHFANNRNVRFSGHQPDILDRIFRMNGCGDPLMSGDADVGVRTEARNGGATWASGDGKVFQIDPVPHLRYPTASARAGGNAPYRPSCRFLELWLPPFFVADGSAGILHCISQATGRSGPDHITILVINDYLIISQNEMLAALMVE